MSSNDETQRCEAEEVVQNTIMAAARMFHQHPFFFINEESLRCMLYSKISQHYSEPIYYKKMPSNELFLSSRYTLILAYIAFLRKISLIYSFISYMTTKIHPSIQHIPLKDMLTHPEHYIYSTDSSR